MKLFHVLFYFFLIWACTLEREDGFSLMLYRRCYMIQFHSVLDILNAFMLVLSWYAVVMCISFSSHYSSVQLALLLTTVNSNTFESPNRMYTDIFTFFSCTLTVVLSWRVFRHFQAVCSSFMASGDPPLAASTKPCIHEQSFSQWPYHKSMLWQLQHHGICRAHLALVPSLHRRALSV